MAIDRNKNSNTIFLTQPVKSITSVQVKNATSAFFFRKQKYKVVDNTIVLDRVYSELKVEYVSQAEQAEIDSRSTRTDFNRDVAQFFPPSVLKDLKVLTKGLQEKFASQETTQLSEIGKTAGGFTSLTESIEENNSQSIEPAIVKLGDLVGDIDIKNIIENQSSLEEMTGGTVSNGNKKIAIGSGTPRNINKMLKKLGPKLKQLERESAVKSSSPVPEAVDFKIIDESQAKSIASGLVNSTKKQLNKLSNPQGAFSGGLFGNVLGALQAKLQNVDPTKDLNNPEVKPYSDDVVLPDNVKGLKDIVDKLGNTNISNNIAPNKTMASDVRPTKSAFDIKSGVTNFNGIYTPSSYKFERVDTVEELDLDLAKCTRPISAMAVHWSRTHTDEFLTARDLHELHSEKQRKKLGFLGTSLLGNRTGIQWHYVILRNGNIQRGRPVDIETNNLNKFAKHTIHVGFIAGYNSPLGSADIEATISSESITQSQWDSFDKIITSFYKNFPNGEIVGHRDYNNQSTCPGFDVLDYVEEKFSRTTSLTLDELKEFNPPAPAEIIDYKPANISKPSKTIPENLCNAAAVSQVNKNVDPNTGDTIKPTENELLAKSESYKELKEKAEALGARLDNKIIAAAKTGDLTDPKRLSGLVEKLELDKEFGTLTGSIDGVRKDLVNGGFNFNEITKSWSK